MWRCVRAHCQCSGTAHCALPVSCLPCYTAVGAGLERGRWMVAGAARAGTGRHGESACACAHKARATRGPARVTTALSALSLSRTPNRSRTRTYGQQHTSTRARGTHTPRILTTQDISFTHGTRHTWHTSSPAAPCCHVVASSCIPAVLLLLRKPFPFVPLLGLTVPAEPPRPTSARERITTSISNRRIA